MLYNLTEQAKQLYELLLSDEIDEQTFQDTFESMEAENRLEYCCKIIRQYDADSKAIEKEIQYLKEKKERAASAAERMKGELLNFMQSIGREKENAGMFKLYVRHSEQVTIDADPRQLPEQYQRVKTTIEPDKAALKEALKAGAVIDGVSLRENQSIMMK